MNTTARPWTISTATLSTLRSLLEDQDTVHGQDNGDYVAYFRAVNEKDRTESIVLKIRIEPHMVRVGGELVQNGMCFALDSSSSPPVRGFTSHLEAYARALKFVTEVVARGLAVEVPSAW